MHFREFFAGFAILRSFCISERKNAVSFGLWREIRIIFRSSVALYYSVVFRSDI